MRAKFSKASLRSSRNISLRKSQIFLLLYWSTFVHYLNPDFSWESIVHQTKIPSIFVLQFFSLIIRVSIKINSSNFSKIFVSILKYVWWKANGVIKLSDFSMVRQQGYSWWGCMTCFLYDVSRLTSLLI